MINKSNEIINSLIIFFWDNMRKRTHRIRPSAHYFKIKYTELMKKNRKKEAFKLLIRGANAYPKDYKLNLDAANYYIEKNEWNKTIKHMKRLLKHHEKMDEVVYINYGKALKKIGDRNKAKKIFKKSLTLYPNAKDIYYELFYIALGERNLDKALQIFNQMDKMKIVIPNKIAVKSAMIYQFYGDFIKADKIYNSIFIDEDSKHKISKLVLFDNGESRIEFYKRHKKMSSVFLTFDSINITWNESPFAFRMLQKEDGDIIALRRKREDSYHQDLSIESYFNAVNQITNYYQRRIAYGFSLGAYTSLYYASSINAEILSISPRNSTHPIYGKGQMNKEKFYHNISHKKNTEIAPIIVYDPKNPTDRYYVDKELKIKFPKGVYIPFPYAGHRIAPYLSQVGVLKEFVQRFIYKQTLPTNKDVNNRLSYQYLRVLGNACLRRNKLNWALSLGEKAIELAPKDDPSYILIIRTLLKQGKEKTALNIINKAIENGVSNPRINSYKTYIELKEKYPDNLDYLEVINEKLI